MKRSPASLTNRVALITGGVARIGAAIAQALHAEGCDLILHYRHSVAAATELKARLEQERPHSVHLVQADLTAPGAIEVLHTSVEQFRQQLDVLVNNASSFYPTPLPEAQPEQWDDLLGTNVRAPFFLTQALAPHLSTSRGCVINLVDIHAERPLARHPIYSIAKAGNAMMVKTLARELGPSVRVNGIAPGAILWPQSGLDGADQAAILERTALQRAGEPEDIARTLLFLVRDAPYITGQIIAVDGGRTLQQ